MMMRHFSGFRQHVELLACLKVICEPGVRRGQLSRTSSREVLISLGETVVKQEGRREKLAQLEALEALEAIQRTEVEKTIKAAAALQTRGAVKIEFALRARYLSGRSWPEIAALLHVQNPAQITAAALHRLAELEENT